MSGFSVAGISPWNLYGARLQLTDLSETAFDDFSLPLELKLDDFDEHILFLDHHAPTLDLRGGTSYLLTSLTLVPEPAGFQLGGFAALLMAAAVVVRRRSRR